MRAVSINKPGDSKELDIQERPIPKPEKGQLLVKVKASAKDGIYKVGLTESSHMVKENN